MAAACDEGFVSLASYLQWRLKKSKVVFKLLPMIVADRDHKIPPITWAAYCDATVGGLFFIGVFLVVRCSCLGSAGIKAVLACGVRHRNGGRPLGL